mmetsp:Transcript_10553/g.24008  ORF Transcript_10553/g.24008 Transcript_10553/m.24008 type:complete len:399 (+) Transcript_10553:69-1265(+)|eukprot:CAMPEP_0178420158 /NCGR_PEP_ID=MMETSP0689_2-20121128/25985_1 /TAXON_ID=160604 /ORGANISM="Amphidinium massartii, Strain CS-259" /LENGTH=398 /DNA_ID=CAMNT_0020041625 /DNA_START=55 /DNA_END=1251 /DNA_ORIENTATION=+
MKVFVASVLALLGCSQALDIALRRTVAHSAVEASDSDARKPATLEGVTLSFEVANYDYGLVLKCFADEMRKVIGESMASLIKAEAAKTNPPVLQAFETYVQIFSGDSKILTLPCDKNATNGSTALAQTNSEVMLNEDADKHCACDIRGTTSHSLIQGALRNATARKPDVSYGTRAEVFMTFGVPIVPAAFAPGAAPPTLDIGSASGSPSPVAPAPAPGPATPPGLATSLLNVRKAPGHPLQEIIEKAITCGSIKSELEKALGKASCVLPTILTPKVAPKKVTEWDTASCKKHMMRIAKLYADAYTPRLVPPAILNECENFMVKATFDRDQLIEEEDRYKCKLISAKFAQGWEHGNYPASGPAPAKVGDYDFGGFCQEICLVKFGPAAAQCRAFNGFRV